MSLQMKSYRRGATAAEIEAELERRDADRRSAAARVLRAEAAIDRSEAARGEPSSRVPRVPAGEAPIIRNGHGYDRAGAVEVCRAEMGPARFDSALAIAQQLAPGASRESLAGTMLASAGFAERDVTPGFAAVAAECADAGVDVERIKKLLGGGTKAEETLVQQWPALRARHLNDGRWRR